MTGPNSGCFWLVLMEEILLDIQAIGSLFHYSSHVWNNNTTSSGKMSTGFLPDKIDLKSTGSNTSPFGDVPNIREAFKFSPNLAVQVDMTFLER